MTMASMGAAKGTLVAALAARGGVGEASMDFAAIYREHFAFVWRTAGHLGVAPDGLDDAVQEVFVVVHRRLGGFASRSSLKTWIYGIVRRVAADHRRRSRRKPPGEGDAITLPTAGRGPDASAEQAEQVLLLRRLLAGLSDDKREVFVLAELEELTLAEIGDALALNPNTVASRLRAARRDFEAALAASRETSHAVSPPHQRRVR
jgi:RNA polymerase sigma-70 factor (ECF subfamily)